MPIGSNLGQVRGWGISDMLGLASDAPRPAMPAAPIAPAADIGMSVNTAGIAKAARGNIFDRIGDKLAEPGMGAALFRSGMATMQGGLGAGMGAGAAYMDQQRAAGLDERRHQQRREEGFSDWQRKEQWERDNPEAGAASPTEMQRNHEFLMSMNPEQAATYLENQVNPMKAVTVGEGGVSFYRSGGTAPTPEPNASAPAPAPGAARPPSPSPARTWADPARYAGLPGERITSGYRDPDHNRRVGGVPNSYHTRRYADGSPMALDSVPPRGMSMSVYAQALKSLNPDAQIINEGDHIHREPGGQGGGSPAAGPVQVHTSAEALRLPPGTTFIDAQGQRRVRP